MDGEIFGVSGKNQLLFEEVRKHFLSFKVRPFLIIPLMPGLGRGKCSKNPFFVRP